MLHSTSVNLTRKVKIYFMTSQCTILEYILEGCTYETVECSRIEQENQKITS